MMMMMRDPPSTTTTTTAATTTSSRLAKVLHAVAYIPPRTGRRTLVAGFSRRSQWTTRRRSWFFLPSLAWLLPYIMAYLRGQRRLGSTWEQHFGRLHGPQRFSLVCVAERRVFGHISSKWHRRLVVPNFDGNFRKHHFSQTIIGRSFDEVNSDLSLKKDGSNQYYPFKIVPMDDGQSIGFYIPALDKVVDPIESDRRS